MKPTVVFGFDMETDIGSWTPFYEGLVHGTPRMLDLLEPARDHRHLLLHRRRRPLAPGGGQGWCARPATRSAATASITRRSATSSSPSRGCSPSCPRSATTRRGRHRRRAAGLGAKVVSFRAPAALGQHRHGERPRRPRLRGRRVLPDVLLPEASGALSPRAERTGPPRAT